MKTAVSFFYLKSYKAVCCLVFLWVANVCLGQDDPNVTFPSPQAWSFIRYGNTPVNLYTGTVMAEIPLYRYTDPDFDFPVSVKYASNGFLPNKASGVVGYDWLLNVGGVISRTVRGMPDDECNMEGVKDIYGNKREVKGYYYFWNNSLSVNPETWVCEMFASERYFPFFYTYFKLGDRYYDVQPDIFHFNFMGYSGSFQLEANGRIHVYNTSVSKGDIKVETIHFNTLSDSYFILRTGDGYRYRFGTFGGNGIDYSYPETGTLPHNKTISSWYLYEISAPNGRKVSLSYNQSGESRIYSPVVNTTFHRNSTSSGAGIRTNPVPLISQTARLSSVNIDNKVFLNFQYDTARAETTVSKGLLAMGKKLTSIIVTEELSGHREQLKKCDFFYTYPSLGNAKLFLEKVRISGEGDYRMSYHDLTSYCPLTATYQMDHWGYYNGKGTDEIPAAVNPVTHEEVLTSTLRDPVFSKGIYGMLKKLTYPTQGYTCFEYEGHSYAKAVKRDLEGAFLATLRNVVNSVAGGVRIRKITDYTGEQAVFSREFLYQQEDKTKSSGILLHYPRYSLCVKVARSKSEEFYFQQSSCYNYNSLDANHIEYSRVLEKQTDGSAVEYCFSNYATVPDQVGGIPVFTVSVPQLGTWQIVNNFDYFKNLTMEPVSFHNQRGKLVMKRVLNPQGHVVSREEQLYGKKPLAYTERILITGNAGYKARTLVDDYTLDRVRQVDYYGTDSIVSQIAYQYNAWGQPVIVDNSCGDGSFHRTYTTYVTDIPEASRTNIDNQMLSDHQIRFPLRTEIKRRQADGSEVLTGGEKNTYALFNGLIQLRGHYKRDILMDGYSLLYSCDAYDKQGRLLQYTDALGLKTVYVWGYGGLYPVASIRNAELAEVAKVTGLFGIRQTPLIAGLSSEQETELRKLSGAHVITCQYAPFKGISRYTDPAGVTCNYEYDAFGRLIRVTDREGRLKDEYVYHIWQAHP
ncbi:RHS repeat domain-containing protein [Culturomica massiliensis]|uniref:RHS repeat domain-containing protein n=1 Tax=Culturomica massiliensis TaxID=1841857 RepID=UPI00266F1A0C|nr:RHS repeat domain-containing protein [Culturomica massiliensis]